MQINQGNLHKIRCFIAGVAWGIAQLLVPSATTHNSTFNTADCSTPAIQRNLVELLNTDDFISLDTMVACGAMGVQGLVQGLSHEDWKIRVIASYTLGQIGSEARAAIPDLAKAIDDENANVRFSVARALGEIGSEQILQSL